MKSSRLKKVIISVLAALLIIGGIAYAALYYLGDRIIEEVIRDDFDVTAIESGQAGQSGENASAAADESIGDTASGAKDGTAGTSMAGTQQSTEATQTSQTAGQTSKSDNQAGMNKAGSNISADNSTKSTTKDKEVVINNSKIAEIKSEVTAEDKISAAALVLKRLSASDINELKNMMSDGLSEEEKAKAKQLAYSRFTETELSEIKEMYSKYMK